MLQQIQRENEHHSQMIVQPKLEIGEKDYAYEQEANTVADKVMCMKEDSDFIQPMEEEDEMVQCMVDTTEESDLASPEVESGIRSTKGGGQLLPSGLGSEMSTKIGADFSNVKVHTDSNAIQMNEELGAKAFTHSNDIYFNKGQYNPSSNQGKHLLAHELTHTVQQGAAIRKKPGFTNGINPKIQKTDNEEQETAFGSFKAPDYHAVTQVSDGKEVGVMMRIQFYPNAKVNATSIGLIQVVKGVRQGKAITEGVKNERQAQSGVGANYFVDVLDDYPSPVYAASKTSEKGKDPTQLNSHDADATEPSLSPIYDGITYNNSGGKYGYRYREGENIFDAPAEHYDHPLIPDLANDSGMTFETVAIALDGEEKGAYYGSVEWGYSKDSTGKFTVLTLKTISQGIPSEKFFTAAKLFNESKTVDFKYVTNKVAELKQGSTSRNLKKDIAIQIIPKSKKEIKGVEWIQIIDPAGGPDGYWIKTADYDTLDLSQDTLDIPMVELFQLNKSSILKTGNKDINLPEQTRVKVLTTKDQMFLKKEWNIQVIDNENYGLVGDIQSDDLVKESYERK